MQPSALNHYQAQLDAGCFVIQRCSACRQGVFYPREVCPHCGSEQLDWEAPSGLGTVHAVTTVRRKPDAGGDLNVSLIELDEGVCMMSRVEDLPPDQVRIGMRVRSRVAQAGGRGLVVFDPVQESAA